MLNLPIAREVEVIPSGNRVSQQRACSKSSSRASFRVRSTRASAPRRAAAQQAFRAITTKQHRVQLFDWARLRELAARCRSPSNYFAMCTSRSGGASTRRRFAPPTSSKSMLGRLWRPARGWKEVVQSGGLGVFRVRSSGGASSDTSVRKSVVLVRGFAVYSKRQNTDAGPRLVQRYKYSSTE